jgi:hypothetical protein
VWKAEVDTFLKQELSELLDAEVKKPSRMRYCPDCRRVMQNMMITLTFGDQESWTLPLPICVICDPKSNEVQSLLSAA